MGVKRMDFILFSFPIKGFQQTKIYHHSSCQTILLVY
jgi:hypothetical protein